MARVLIVDESTPESAVLESALRVEGYDVVLCSCAEEAKDHLAGSDVELAIVELMLHGRNGLELARELKQRHPLLKLVLTGAYHLSEQQLERADCGVLGFVPKPYDLAELLGYLRRKVPSESAGRLMLDRRAPLADAGDRHGTGVRSRGAAARRASSG